MISRLISVPLLVVALIIGLWVSFSTKMYLSDSRVYYLGAGVLAFLLCYAGSEWVMKTARRGLRALNRLLDTIAIEILLGGTVGLLLGALFGLLTGFPLSMIQHAGAYLAILSFALFGYLGLKIGTRRAADVMEFLPILNHDSLPASKETRSNYKVLDTSAIIDGRIYDVCISRFLEGSLVVPIFVIEELQHIADSSDNLRRNKGRRGLELLSKMQKHPTIKIDIMEGNIPEEKEVDMKLIRLCKQLDASIITNDYNLNKVAELQGITVLNINELTNAVKVVVYPGETMHIHVLKEGKEIGQGVGYLEDGTMVVVEDAQDEIGSNLEVLVTSVFQTAAGRMIFTRKTREEASAANPSLQSVPIQEVNVFG